MRISESLETDCSRVRAALRAGRSGASEEIHLFRCAACRVESRIAAAWRSIPSPEAEERRVPADEAFVARAMRGIREERRRRDHARKALAAAAVLLFFFFAVGAGREAANSPSLTVDDSYAQLVNPDVVDSLLPD